MSVFSNILKIKELRNRILFTLGLVFICRILSTVPIPGVDVAPIAEAVRQATQSAGGVMGTFAAFTGVALERCAVGTLSIWPYITASIIIQLMTAIIPALERMAREGEVGRQKLNQTTRYLALGICGVQAFFLAKALENPASLGIAGQLVAIPGFSFELLTVLSVTTATMFTMWLGEQITERGVGNGSSVIIMVNICSRLPGAVIETVQGFMKVGGQQAQFNAFHLFILLGVAFLVFAGTIAVTQALRRVPIHTARRSVGANRVVGGTDSYIPLRLNFAGVMPIIFAGPILAVAGLIFSLPNVQWLSWLKSFGMMLKNPSSPTHLTVYAVLIIFFSFFWVATQFHAVQMADELKGSNGYIPGIRPGMPTAEFLDLTMTRVTFIGAIALVVIAILPTILSKMILRIPESIAGFFGGTSLLIIVGVALDTLRQVESYLVMRNYEGFLKHGRLRGRR